ncbi:radical SAM family heme chaperone HemW [Priestia abyssalis]|uniref:radical SAM family heme chaperone HemW n=1 Tax=Priestia abyssalis TaxID=1221450 RepID=UPI000994B888|nr:radical SAM family heme chaperone HemW [Priestia abyssalis]
MVQAAYLHIPFCHHICHYCDFNKVFFDNQPVDDYLNAMEQEMKNTVEKHGQNRLKSIFVGGGTPTALTESQLDKFLEMTCNHLSLEENGEFTFEANPNELTEKKLQLLKEYGVNRLSIGVQTFNDELLKGIGRVHTKNEAVKTIQRAREMGFQNLSLDLMYSLPGQTMEDFSDTLQQAFELDIDHMSAYSLIIEPKTVFYNLMRRGKLNVPPQEIEAKMYDELMMQMEKHGFKQYEISNFAKDGFESRHNLTYWNNEEYYGIGAGAHGYVQGVRRANIGPINKYIDTVSQNGFAYMEEHEVTKTEMMEEEMFLGLRKKEGVSKRTFKQKYSVELKNVFGEQVHEQMEKGLLTENEECFYLTRQGRFLGNEVFQAFIGVI